MLVTHDRYMLDRVSTVVLGLDGRGGAERFADYSQWEDWQKPAKTKSAASETKARANNLEKSVAAESARQIAPKKKLSYTETRELAGMEENIAAAEEDLERKRQALEEPSIMSDGAKLHAASLELEQAQKKVEHLYTRWAELEQKQGVTSESLG